MGGRFSRIMQAERLKKAKDELDKWAQMTGEERSALYAATKRNTGNKKTNRNSVAGYVKPFGPKNTDDIFVETLVLGTTVGNSDPASEESAGQLLVHLKEVVHDGTFYTTVKPASGATIAGKVSPSKLARVTIATVGEKLANGITSRLTKQKYTYRKRDSLSAVFGMQHTGGNATQTFEGNSSTIKSALKLKNSEYKIYFRAQQVTGVEMIE